LKVSRRKLTVFDTWRTPAIEFDSLSFQKNYSNRKNRQRRKKILEKRKDSKGKYIGRKKILEGKRKKKKLMNQ
jgi:hypothetical protein